MIRWTIALSLLGPSLLGLSLPASAQTAPPPAAATAPATIEQVVPRIDAHFRAYMAESHIPGLVYGIVQNGRLVHVGTMGVQDPNARRPVDADSLFRIASMSKAFTALAILKLRDEGRLSLDALAETYVPEMRRWRYPTSDSPRIRVRDLLSHVAGLVTDNPWGDRQQVLPEAQFTAMLRAGPPFNVAPQAAYSYSNYGYALLGRIISNASGRPYADYIREEIMRPLGMASSGYDIFASPGDRRAIGYRWENDAFVREPDMANGAFGAMGGVETSANDYARWVAFLLSAWPPRDGAEHGPVRRSSVRELGQGLNFVQYRDRPGIEGVDGCRMASAYGMGFSQSADCVLGTVMTHGGGYPGYGSYLLMLPDYGVGIFAFANRTYGAPSVAVFQAALELQHAGAIQPRAVPVSPVLARAYRAVGATYQAGTLAPIRDMLAMNFLMDRSAENWALELARVQSVVGACPTDAPLAPSGALEAHFAWTCARGAVRGYLLLAPTDPATIQELHVRIDEPSQ